jgi:signal transduction histidine kinase
MKRQWVALSRRYQAALQQHLQQGLKGHGQLAHRLGKQAVALGLENRDLARMHKEALSELVLPGEAAVAKDRLLKRAGFFFTEASTPFEKTGRAGMELAERRNGQSKMLKRRTAQLTATNLQLKQGVVEQKAAEEALRKRGRRFAKLLRESHQSQMHLRRLTHRLLSAQEARRKKLSHQLHDGVGQTLLGINVRLLTLKKAAEGNMARLTKEIASARRVVKESVQSINRFAHELEIRQPT